MTQATLCLLIKEGQSEKELLLAMKKRGFGIGKWNGVGGKIELAKGDINIVEAAIREAKEEIGVKIKKMEKVAVLSFHFPYKKEWDQDVHVFLAKNWEGEPKESEEMLPKWFKISEIPFNEMWDDDKFWLLKVLEGKRLKAKFTFGPGEKIISQNIRII